MNRGYELVFGRTLVGTAAKDLFGIIETGGGLLLVFHGESECMLGRNQPMVCVQGPL